MRPNATILSNHAPIKCVRSAFSTRDPGSLSALQPQLGRMAMKTRLALSALAVLLVAHSSGVASPHVQPRLANNSSAVNTACVPRFESDEGETVARTFSANGFRYETDAQGRPARAVATRPLGGRAEQPRDRQCERAVGRAFTPGNSKFRRYGGGHLIGTQLGGVSRRYNLVPQDGNFNSIIYKQIERQASECEIDDEVFMSVDVTYPNETTLVPETFLVRVWFEERAEKQATFANTRGADHAEALIRADVLADFLEEACGG